MPPRLWLWIALTAAAGALLYWAPPEDDVVAPTATRRAAAADSAAVGRAAAGATAPAVLEIRPREASNDAITRLWLPSAASAPAAPPSSSPPRRPARVVAEVPSPAPPPQAPPLPFRLLGRYNDEDHAGVVLLHDGQVVVVHAGDSLAEVYRVETISGNVMMLTYLPLNLQQPMDIGVAQ